MKNYEFGRYYLLSKLGMEAGIVPYVATKERDSSFSENKKQDFWKNFDDQAFVTGEESGVGMPSPSKVATENDGAYGAPSGSYGVGGLDANQALPDRSKRISDALSAAFESNRLYDQSYGPEAAITQPHGPKLGGLINPLKIKSPMSSSVGMMGKRTSGIAPKPMGISNPLSKPMGMSIPKPGSMPSVGTNIQNNLAGTAGPTVPPMGVDHAMTSAGSHVGKLIS